MAKVEIIASAMEILRAVTTSLGGSFFLGWLKDHNIILL